MLDTVGDQRLGLLVRGRFDSGDFAMFTGYGEVVWDGVTYLGAGEMISIGEVAETNGDGSGGLTITLSGISPEVIALAELEPFQRRRVTVYLAVLDASGSVLGADVFFDGIADNISSNDNPVAPSVTLTCEQRSFDLNRPRPFKYLPEDQKKRHTGDTFFDLVQGIQNIEGKWGDA